VTGGSTKHYGNSTTTTEMLQKDTNRWITSNERLLVKDIWHIIMNRVQ